MKTWSISRFANRRASQVHGANELTITTPWKNDELITAIINEYDDFSQGKYIYRSDDFGDEIKIEMRDKNNLAARWRVLVNLQLDADTE